MKTIREVIAVLDSLLSNIYAFRSSGAQHTIACLRRARQIVKSSACDWQRKIVKASERRSEKKKGKR